MSANLRSLNVAFAAAVLLAAVGCDMVKQTKAPAMQKLSDFGSGKTAYKPGPDADKSPEQIRNEALEKVSKNLDKVNKAAEEALKNKDKDKVAKKKESRKDQPPLPMVLGGNTPIVELDPTQRSKKKGETNSIPIPDAAPSNNKFAEIVGPNQSSLPSVGGTANLSNAPKKTDKKSGARADLQVMNGTGTTQFDDGASSSAKDGKPNFFQRLLGFKPKPETRIIKEAESGKQIELVNDRMDKSHLGQVSAEKPDGTAWGSANSADPKTLKHYVNPNASNQIPSVSRFKPAGSEYQGLESERIKAEVAIANLNNEAATQKKTLDPKTSAKDAKTPGGVHHFTDFDDATKKSKESASPSPSAPSVAPANSSGTSAPAASPALHPNDNGPITAASPVNANVATAAPPAAVNVSKDDPVPVPAPAPPQAPAQNPDDSTEIQKQFGTLEDYKKGLATRDMVVREYAFQRAAAERRQDAIPFLAEEVARNGMLSVLAARVLAVIGKTNDAVEHALADGLNTTAGKDAPLREACAQTLGQLHVRRAVPLLIDKANKDKNYTVRCACVGALGAIGDPAALDALHAKLDDRLEIEFVKQSTALALARMGDSAGRDHLVESLDSPMPAFQVLGLTGLVQLRDPGAAGYLISCLDSRYDEVWTTAVLLFPRLSARTAVPLLKDQLISPNASTRLRASLALGFLGCADGIALICRATRSNALQERAMGCELLGRLGRKEQIPLLIERLSDPSSGIRQTAAVALSRLDAKAAIPAIAEAARGRFQSQLIQPVRLQDRPNYNEHDTRSILSVQTGSPSDMSERLVMLACLRILRGEKDDLILNTLPSSRDSSWPELDRELAKQQIDMVKLYKLVDVVPSGTGAAGALIQGPGGQEILYRKGEPLAAGFKIGDISLGAVAENKNKIPPFVTLLRGDERIVLYQGQESEVENVREGAK